MMKNENEIVAPGLFADINASLTIGSFKQSGGCMA
jgi:hypothetical protein